MKRIEFAITSEDGQTFLEPQFLETCAELPVAVMRAIEDYLESRDGKLELPILIRIHPSPDSSTC